jgi:hypothetical protein
MARVSHRPVKFSAEEMASDLPAELDFTKLKAAGRGARAIEGAARRKLVALDPDVAKEFGSAQAVNEALRAMQKLRRMGKRKAG